MKELNVGNVIGNLEILSITGKRMGMFNCRCKCGKERTLAKSRLINKHDTCCGDKKCKTFIKHGITNNRFYRKWDGINGRCYRTANDSYSRYGGSGIKSSWYKNFQKFYDEMHDSYQEHVAKYGVDNTWIERINSKKDYCKENCKWATIKEQSINKSSTVFIEYRGESLPLAYIERKYHIPKLRLSRLLGRGWTKEQICKSIDNGDIFKDLRHQYNMPSWVLSKEFARRQKISDFYKNKREVRLYTAGEDNEVKQLLAQEKIIELKS